MQAVHAVRVGRSANAMLRRKKGACDRVLLQLARELTSALAKELKREQRAFCDVSRQSQRTIRAWGDRVWEAIWAELHAALRERLGCEAGPTAAVLDGQTLKSAEKGAVKTTRWVMTPASG